MIFFCICNCCDCGKKFKKAKDLKVGFSVCLIIIAVFSFGFFVIHFLGVKYNLDRFIDSYDTVSCSLIYPIDEIIYGVELGPKSIFRGLDLLKEPIDNIKTIVADMKAINQDMTNIPTKT